MSRFTSPEFRETLARTRASPLALVAVVASVAAGALHLYVTPMHVREALPQGAFMATLGAWQLAWAARSVRRPSPASYAAGIVTAVASVVVWIAAIVLGPPFGRGPEAPETIAYVTKAIEIVGLVALLALPIVVRGRAPRLAMRTVALALVACLLVGVASGAATYGAGRIGERVLPGLRASGDADMGMGGDAPAATADGMGMPMGADKTLAPVKIALTNDGSSQTAKATIDANVKHLVVTVWLNDSGPGPYAALGPGGQGDLAVQLQTKGGAPTKVAMGGTASTAGVDPAAPAAKGPFKATIDAPAAGEWTIAVLGQGNNAAIAVQLVEQTAA